jgi:SAM-dependent methyltransferase
MSELPLFPLPTVDDSVKGFALTPTFLVDTMVSKLFAKRAPTSRDRVLDPGCGTGEFISGVLRWCTARGIRPPQIVGIEQHSGRASEARRRFRADGTVDIRTADFLKPAGERFDFIIGNPPYVAITELSATERARYRRDFETATGRFDLYSLFFEQSLSLLRPEGRLVFVTPEKFLYVASAASLRVLMTRASVAELAFAPEDVFGDLVTYPIITTVDGARSSNRTRVQLRDGTTRSVRLSPNGESWLPIVLGSRPSRFTTTLGDVATRVSCGVATGADSVFVLPQAAVSRALSRFAIDTLAGRQLAYGVLPEPTHQMLVPYDALGRLLEEEELGPLLPFLQHPERRAKLLARTCAESKPWYAFHETPPMREMGKPKILCKDIGASPHFAIDASGSILPRHSVYFIIPAVAEAAEDLCTYLNSPVAQRWLRENCHRAAKGFIRLQSTTLKQLPVPPEFVPADRTQDSPPEIPTRRSA